MEIQYSKMILHGIIAAIFYLVVPLVLFYILDDVYHIITFSESFKITIIILGVIGIVMSLLKHAFPKDTSAYSLVRFGITVYSGIFLFYIFGGFTPGTSLGTYYIDTSIGAFSIQVLLGLQIIAWLFLGSTIIRGLQYLTEAIERRKKKEYRVKVKKSFKLSRVFKGLGIIASLVILGYFGTIIFSGMNLGLDIGDTIDYDYDPGINPPPDYSDDSLNITMTFGVRNMGIYAIRDVVLNAEIKTLTTDDPMALPENTIIGGFPSAYQNTFHAFTETLNQNITISMNPTYIEGLMTTNATLQLKLSFSTMYAWILINLNFSIQVPWSPSP